MIWILFITAFSVSIDSFFCGFYLTNSEKKYLPSLIIAVLVFLMCLTCQLFANIINNFLNEKALYVGGIILIAIGIFNLIKKDSGKRKKRKSITETVVIGLTVGIDGSLGTLSLYFMGITSIFVPVLIAFFHAVLIYLGQLVKNSKYIDTLDKYKVFAPLVLIILGVLKLF